jgi:hypothetical protein
MDTRWWTWEIKSPQSMVKHGVQDSKRPVSTPKHHRREDRTKTRKETKSKHVQNLIDAFDRFINWGAEEAPDQSVINGNRSRSYSNDWSIPSCPPKVPPDRSVALARRKTIFGMTDLFGHAHENHHQISRWCWKKEEWLWSDQLVRSLSIEAIPESVGTLVHWNHLPTVTWVQYLLKNHSSRGGVMSILRSEGNAIIQKKTKN